MRLNVPVTLIGLTGGIAAGKSTVAERFREHGAHILDADQQARDVVAPGSPALEQIRARFGDDVIDDHGGLNRTKLGSIVFTEDGARAELEGITHPAIRELTKDRIAEIRERDPGAVIVYDVPLLVEANVRLPFTAVVVVQAAAGERLRRLVELRGMSADEAKRRIESQATDEERLAVADYVVEADGTLEATIRNADHVWRKITARI